MIINHNDVFCNNEPNFEAKLSKNHGFTQGRNMTRRGFRVNANAEMLPQGVEIITKLAKLTDTVGEVFEANGLVLKESDCVLKNIRHFVGRVFY